jgi:hypothetical protein
MSKFEDAFEDASEWYEQNKPSPPMVVEVHTMWGRDENGNPIVLSQESRIVPKRLSLFELERIADVIESFENAEQEYYEQQNQMEAEETESDE